MNKRYVLMQRRVEVLQEELKKPMSVANKAFIKSRLTKYQNALRDLETKKEHTPSPNKKRAALLTDKQRKENAIARLDMLEQERKKLGTNPERREEIRAEKVKLKKFIRYLQA